VPDLSFLETAVKKQGLLYKIRTCELAVSEDIRPTNARFSASKRGFEHCYLILAQLLHFCYGKK